MPKTRGSRCLGGELWQTEQDACHAPDKQGGVVAVGVADLRLDGHLNIAEEVLRLLHGLQHQSPGTGSLGCCASLRRRTSAARKKGSLQPSTQQPHPTARNTNKHAKQTQQPAC